MVKDIMELSSEEDLKEFLNEQLGDVTKIRGSIIGDITRVENEQAETVFAIKSVDDVKGVDPTILYYYIQAIQTLATDLNVKAEHKLSRILQQIDSRMNYLPTVMEAIEIKQHWDTLRKHFEENPSLKEEWDALCMGIKLTEDN